MKDIVEVEKYYPRQGTPYAGNPLIEAFPQLTRANIIRIMANPVRVTSEQLSHSSEQRQQDLSRLNDYFIPLPQQIDFAVDLWEVIQHGYASRNPLKTQTTAKFHKFCEAIFNGDIFEDEEVGGSFQSSPLAVTLIGTPGTGKGRTVQALLNKFPSKVLHHSSLGPIYQLLYIWAEAPDTDSYFSLLQEIYWKLHEAASSIGAPVPALPAKPTRGNYENVIALLAKKLNLGLLIVDELQHLVGGRNIDKKTMQFLTGFVNRIGVPVLIIGTWPALAILGSEMRLMRRSINRGSKQFYRIEEGALWDSFIKGLFRMQWTKHTVAHDEEDFVPVFYHHCQGIPDLAVKLMMLAQLHAIRTGEERLSVPLIDAVAEEHFPIIAPAIKQMRNGWKETEPILWDAEPKDFYEYFEHLRAESAVQGRLKNVYKFPRKNIAATSKRVAESLVATGITDEASAGILAANAVARSPDKSAPELVTQIINKAKPKSLRPSKSVKHQKQFEAAIGGLKDEDIRKVIYLANRDGEQASTALAKANHVVSAGQEGLL